jgi:hypothetical protein
VRTPSNGDKGPTQYGPDVIIEETYNFITLMIIIDHNDQDIIKDYYSTTEIQ